MKNLVLKLAHSEQIHMDEVKECITLKVTPETAECTLKSTTHYSRELGINIPCMESIKEGPGEMDN